MADSENSRTMPANTRRKVPSALTLVAPVGAAFEVEATALASPTDDADPALRLWMEWQEAHSRYVKLRREAEACVLSRPDIRDATLRQSEGPDTMAGDRITHALSLPTNPKVESTVRSNRPAMKQPQAMIDDATSYSDVVEAECRAAERHSALARKLLSTPTRSVVGVAAKLNCFIETSSPASFAQKHRHPALPGGFDPNLADLRAILTDLVMIGGVSNGLFRG